MPSIKITVQGKIATAEKDAFIVCGNEDYIIEFDFIDEWGSQELKTALFVFNGKLVPIPFVGSSCEVPIVQNAQLLGVGVETNDGKLKTTTPAYIPCKRNARDIAQEQIEKPTLDVYSQIVGMINEGMVKGDKGDKGDKGEKGDAGAIKFIPVAELPTENIQEDALYLVPIENAGEQNKFTAYAYVNGDWEAMEGITAQIDPDVYVKFTDYATAIKAGVVKVSSFNGLNMSGGTITLQTADNGAIDNKSAIGAVGNSGAITPSNGDYFLKKGITTNTETLTDEEKTSACEWLGALQKVSERTTYDQMWFKSFDGTWRLSNAAWNVTNAGGICVRDSAGYIYCSKPAKYNQTANKGYVDDGFVAKQTATPNQGTLIYAYNASGDFALSVNEGAYGNTVARRTASGTLKAKDGTADDDLVTVKQYNELLARIEALEGK